MRIDITKLITMPEIQSWNKGEIILIDAPTGSGKTSFIKYNLKGHCRAEHVKKRILMLSNRNILKEQNQIDLGDDTYIKSENYQWVEENIRKNKPIEYYDYIVADEAHYVFTDSDFNRSTDLTFNWLSKQSNSIVILLSATSTMVKKYFEKVLGREIRKYKYCPEYSYIDKFYFFKSEKAIETLLSELPSNEKAIYFTTIKEAYRISKTFLNAKFICSQNSKNPLAKNIDIATKEEILKHKKFSCQILCTTNALDNGVSIIDPDIKHIIISYFDLDTIQQCFGRKRIQGDEKVNLYVKEFNNRAVNGYLTDSKNKLTPAYYLKNNGEEAFDLKYFKKDYDSRMIDHAYDYENKKTILTVNEIMFFKTQEAIKLCEQILDKNNDISFKSLVVNRFNREINDTRDLEDEYDDYKLTSYLEKLVGVKLFKRDQGRLKKYIIEDIFKPARTNHGRISYNTINNFFEDLELPFEIRSHQENSRKSKNYKKTYWMVYRLSDSDLKITNIL